MPAATRLVGVGPGWLGGPRVDPGKTTLASMGRLAPPLCLGNDMGVATVIMPNVLGWLPVKHAHERQTLLCPGDANEALHHACPGDGVVRSDAVDREDCVLVVGLGGKGDGSDNCFCACPCGKGELVGGTCCVDGCGIMLGQASSHQTAQEVSNDYTTDSSIGFLQGDNTA